MRFPPLVTVNAVGFADAYQQLVAACMKEGKTKRRFYGVPLDTRDIVSTTSIIEPETQPMLHPGFPTGQKHLGVYVDQLKREFDWKAQGFEYSYGDRLMNYPKVTLPNIDSLDAKYYSKSHGSEPWFIDQLKILKENIAKRIAKGGECLISNRDQAITWIPDRDMFVSEDQPCLQRIQIFIWRFPLFDENGILTKEGIGEYHLDWRSRDGFTAWNSNMIAVYEMMKREVFAPNNIKIGRVVDFCNSFHIYAGDWDKALKLISKNTISANPQTRRY